MVDIASAATNLQLRENGVWHSRSRSLISYPEDGNTLCFGIEEDSFWFRHRNNCVVEAMRLFPPMGAVFDVGGGNGYVSMGIQNAGFDVVVVEPGYEGIRNAQSRGLSNLVCSTLEDAGFKPHSLPAVGLFDVLEHVENDMGFLETIQSLLVPKGRLYVHVPAYGILWSAEDENAGHFRRYTLGDLAAKLSSVGFVRARDIHLRTTTYSSSTDSNDTD